MATTAQIRALYGKRAGAAAAPAAVTPQAIAPDPMAIRQTGAAGRRRDLTIEGIDAAQKATQSEYGGWTTDVAGNAVIDPGNPRSRAALLQQEWQNQRANRYQNVGNNLYSSSFAQGRAADNAGETGAFGDLLLEKNNLLGGYATQRLGAVGTYNDTTDTIADDLTTRLAQNPNDSTVSDRTVGVNPDGSAVTSGQTGVNKKTGQAYILWFNGKGQAYNIYADGHRVRMKAQDKVKK